MKWPLLGTAQLIFWAVQPVAEPHRIHLIVILQCPWSHCFQLSWRRPQNSRQTTHHHALVPINCLLGQATAQIEAPGSVFSETPLNLVIENLALLTRVTESPESPPGTDPISLTGSRFWVKSDAATSASWMLICYMHIKSAVLPPS